MIAIQQSERNVARSWPPYADDEIMLITDKGAFWCARGSVKSANWPRHQA